MTTIGIDPGKQGGIAVLEGDDVTTYAIEKLTTKDVWLTLAALEPANVWMEKVSATPQMGVTSAFTFGEGYGTLLALCIAAGLRVELISPRTWQRTLRLKTIGGKIGQNSTAKKNRNKAKAQELFPSLKITHAIADALLIAEYGRRQAVELVEVSK